MCSVVGLWVRCQQWGRAEDARSRRRPAASGWRLARPADVCSTGLHTASTIPPVPYRSQHDIAREHDPGSARWFGEGGHGLDSGGGSRRRSGGGQAARGVGAQPERGSSGQPQGESPGQLHALAGWLGLLDPGQGAVQGWRVGSGSSRRRCNGGGRAGEAAARGRPSGALL